MVYRCNIDETTWIYMAVTWKLHGSYLETTWGVLGCYLGVIVN